MEEYAYRLTCELSRIGVKVYVVCEEKIDEPEDGTIEIVQLGKSLRKPRWLSHLIFAKKVRNWVMINAGQNTIIHSHERINCHQVTTIHTTLYNFPPKRKFPSLRNYLNEHIESRELNCASIQENRTCICTNRRSDHRKILKFKTQACSSYSSWSF